MNVTEITIPRSQWQWFGDPGHLIVSSHCRFHLTTRVGNYLVSTVGKYVPDSGVQEILASSRGLKLEGRGDVREADFLRKNGFEPISFGRTYETMVFEWVDPCKDPQCGGLAHVGGPCLESDSYNDAQAATEGHYRLCELAARGVIPMRLP